MASQAYKSLRIFQSLTPPAAFSKADPTSYVPFLDWTIPATDPFDGSIKAPQQAQAQGVSLIVGTGSVDFSFDGTNIHGTITQADGYVFFPGIREREIYFQQTGGASPGASVRVWAW